MMALDARVGQLVADRFRLEEEIGRGGMGAVFRARDVADGSVVALKLLLCTTESVSVERFRREALGLSRVQHPAVVGYRAHGTSRQCLFLAMELLDGMGLEKIIRGAGLGTSDTLVLMRRVTAGLGALHAEGIIHRDLKPQNIFLPAGRPELAKLIDLGIAHFQPARHPLEPLTKQGFAVGTPGYMAPEQIRGEEPDARSDLYSLGVVAFECLTGRRAFRGPDVMSVMGRVLFQAPASVRESRPELPESLESVVASLMARDRQDRPANAADLIRLLSNIAPVDNRRPSQVAVTASTLSRLEQRVGTVVVMIPPETGEGLVPASDPSRLAFEIRRHLQTAVDQYEARLEVMANGSAVAVFSAGESPDEQALRAVRFARAARQVVRGYVGVATGRTLASNQVPVGDAIERATAACRGAPTSDVVLDAYTSSLVGDFYSVQTFRMRNILGPPRSQTIVPPLADGATEQLIGRDREFGLLNQAYADVSGGDGAQVVLITGDAGLGKSWLVNRFIASVTAEKMPPRIVRGRGDPTYAGSAFSMLRVLLFNMCGVLPSDDRQTALRKVRAAIEPVVPEGQWAELWPWIRRLLGVRSIDSVATASLGAAQLAGDRLYPVLVDVVDRELARGPIVMVLKDLQWGDYATNKWIDLCLRRFASRPFLVVATGRPEIHDQFPSLWAEHSLSEIKLGRLPARTVERILETRAPTLDATTRGRIVALAEGNPFYVDELIRATESGTNELPDTVVGLVLQRFTAMDAEARFVLRAASIFGVSFPVAGLEALLVTNPNESVDLAGWIRVFERDGIVVGADPGEARFPGEYRFRHPLVREAHYKTLLAPDCEKGHRLAAQFLERTEPIDARVIAEHFERAREPASAARHFAAAAAEAMVAGDLRCVIELARRGIMQRPGDDLISTLWRLEGEAQLWVGDPRRARACAIEAINRTRRVAALTALLVDSAAVLGEPEDIDEFVAPLMVAPPKSNSEQMEWAGAVLQIAASLVMLGRLEDASRAVAIVLEKCAPTVDVAPIETGRLHHARGHIAVVSGRLVDAMREYELGAAAFRRGRALRLLSGELTNLGSQYLELGDYDRAQSILSEALESGQRIGSLYCEAFARTNLGRAWFGVGHADEAFEALERASREFAEIGDRRLEAQALAALAEILLHGGRESEARVALARAEQLADDLPTAYAPIAAMRAKHALTVGELDIAERYATEAIQTLERRGTEERRAFIRVTSAEVAAQLGDRERARSILRIAIEEIESEAAKLDDSHLAECFLRRHRDHVHAFEFARTLGL